MLQTFTQWRASDRVGGARVQGAMVQLFTERGNYHLAYEEASLSMRQRLAVAAAAISIDFDFFSRRIRPMGFFYASDELHAGDWASSSE
jgi:hypothetical protein